MKCKFTKPSGEQCKANATKGSDCCFTHNPAYAEEKALAVTKGGLNRRLRVVYGETLKLQTPKDIKRLLAETINKVWLGEMPSNQPANSIGFLARCFLDAHEASEVETRLDGLETRLTKAGL